MQIHRRAQHNADTRRKITCPECRRVYGNYTALKKHKIEEHSLASKLKEIEGMRKVSPSKRCDHLNAETRVIGGVSVVVCKDCAQHVDPSVFEVPVPPKPAEAPKPPSSHPAGPPAGMVALDIIYDGPVQLVKVGKFGIEPFFPVFNVKEGERIVIARKK